MRKVAFAVGTCAAMTMGPVAFAQPARADAPTEADESSCGAESCCCAGGHDEAHEAHEGSRTRRRARRRARTGEAQGAESRTPGAGPTSVGPAQAGRVQTGEPTSTTTITSVPLPVTLGPVPREPETLTAHASIPPNRTLLYVGLGTFAGAYTVTAALTATRVLQHPDRTSYIPVVGPWLHLKDVPEGARDKILLAGTGVVQAAGLGLTIAGLFVPEDIPLATIDAAGVAMSVAPTAFGVGSSGVLATGRF